MLNLHSIEERLSRIEADLSTLLTIVRGGRVRAADPQLRAILETVAADAGISAAKLVRRDNRAAFVEPRRRAMFLMREAGGTLEEIGRIMRRHHSTVLHNVRMYEEGTDGKARGSEAGQAG